jgi:hypothetical protein
MTKSEIEKDILELCAEDYYGVWELYWPCSSYADKSPKDVDLFINTIKELVDAKKIASYEQDQDTKEFHPVVLDLDRLRHELGRTMAGDIDWGFYWFAKID